MNRFALIPLAILANACASQADIEAMAEDAEADIRELLERNDGDSERGALGTHKVRQRVVRHTVQRFEELAASEGCTIEGVALGHWRDRSFEYRGLALNLEAKHMADLTGSLTYDDNDSGDFYGKDIRSTGDIRSVDINGQWMAQFIDADVSITHVNAINNEKFTLFAKWKQRGLGGHFVGVLADCE